MKKIIRLCSIVACTLLLFTGCGSKYERDDNPGRVENITVSQMQKKIENKKALLSCLHRQPVHTVLILKNAGRISVGSQCSFI